jgi:hypothetical protein
LGFVLSVQVTVSIIILGMFVLLELGPTSAQFMPLLHALLPWALHHRHAVRVPVQVRCAGAQNRATLLGGSKRQA